MKSFEANKRVVKDRAKIFSKRLGISDSMVYKWTEESSFSEESSGSCTKPSGRQNPVDVIEQMIEIAIAFEDPREDYISQIVYLEERFKRIGIDIPANILFIKPSDVTRELIKTTKEFGDLMTATSKALEKEGINKKENEKIQSEGWQLLRQVVALMALSNLQATGKMM